MFVLREILLKRGFLLCGRYKGAKVLFVLTIEFVLIKFVLIGVYSFRNPPCPLFVSRYKRGLVETPQGAPLRTKPSPYTYLGVDAGRSGLASEGGDSGERMGDPPGTLPPLEEDEALSVTTSFHELATDSLVARCGCCCCSPPGDSAFFFLSNRFSNMGCTSSPPGSSSDVACARPPVRLRSAASASKMRLASSSSATPPPTAAVCGWAPRLVLLLVLLVTTTVPAVALPPSLLLPPLFLVELLLLLQLSSTPVDEVTTFRPEKG